MQLKDVTASSFGLLIAFLLPGMAALFGLRYWSESTAGAFDTFLEAEANIGLFLFLLLGALTLGLVISVVRWFVYEVVLMYGDGVYGKRLTEQEKRRLSDPDRYASFRHAIDETYRYHQCFGGLSVAAPLLFAGWVKELDASRLGTGSMIVGIVGLETLLIAATITAFRSYLRYAKAILSKPATRGSGLSEGSKERTA